MFPELFLEIFLGEFFGESLKDLCGTSSSSENRANGFPHLIHFKLPSLF
jgi:hypothetical protein